MIMNDVNGDQGHHVPVPFPLTVGTAIIKFSLQHFTQFYEYFISLFYLCDI